KAITEVVRHIEADGVFLDTLDHAGGDLRAELNRARRGVALESEGGLPIESIPDHHLSWAQWFDDSQAPGVLRNRWYEQRHTMHVIRRWDLDHSGELHMAWMNGTGMLVWENVFGSWVPWATRDRATYRAMLPIQRHFHRHFSEGIWTPLVPTQIEGV